MIQNLDTVWRYPLAVIVGLLAGGYIGAMLATVDAQASMPMRQGDSRSKNASTCARRKGRLLNNNTRTRAIAAAGGQLYRPHNNGGIWRSDGRGCTGHSCPGWVRLDNNPRSVAIVAGEH